MLTDARVNAILDTEFGTGATGKFSLHTAFSTTGANEVTGGTYAKQTPTWSAAASRSKATSGNIDFAIPAGTTVAWIGVWDNAGTTFKGMWPNGGTDFSFQINDTANSILCEGHGLANGDRCAFTGTTLPTGLTAGTHYFVTGVTAADPDTFQVEATSGGGAIAFAGQPSHDARVSKIILETYAGAGTHRVSAFSVGL